MPGSCGACHRRGGMGGLRKGHVAESAAGFARGGERWPRRYQPERTTTWRYGNARHVGDMGNRKIAATHRST